MPTRGSSPLTRGKPGRGLGRRGLARLIPAHAGKTTPRRSLEASRKAHPRSRGENDPSGSVSHSHPGSSPLTRGKRRLTGVHAWRRGLIPAHAGKTDERELEGLRSAAHPRSRGENCDAVGHVVADGGSSPLTRGKHSGRRELPDGPRLIPAHAGKTTLPMTSWSRSRAHPRSRGENRRQSSRRCWMRGSSPLTRGKRDLQVARVGNRRLIPAHAGKTATGATSSHITTAHPRSRGENHHVGQAPQSILGSSPLTRGKPSSRACATSAERLIPAHAGKTRRSLRWAARGRAHPRSRGENTS